MLMRELHVTPETVEQREERLNSKMERDLSSLQVIIIPHYTILLVAMQGARNIAELFTPTDLQQLL